MTGMIYIASKDVVIQGSHAMHFYLVYAPNNNVNDNSTLRIIRGGPSYGQGADGNAIEGNGNLLIETNVLLRDSADFYKSGETSLTRGSVPLSLNGQDTAVVWQNFINTANKLGNPGGLINHSYVGGGNVRDTGVDYDWPFDTAATYNSNATIRSLLAANNMLLEDNLPTNLTAGLLYSTPGQDTLFVSEGNDKLLVGFNGEIAWPH